MINNIIFRPPKKEDGLDVYKLITSCPPLDINSLYYYYIMCDDFSKTSLIAELNNRVVGYISGYKPLSENSIFIWQVAIDKSVRGKGIASQLLNRLVNNCATLGICKIKTTISPSNKASQNLFTSFASFNQFSFRKDDYLKPDDFGSKDHEAEELYTIKFK